MREGENNIKKQIFERKENNRKINIEIREKEGETKEKERKF